eukprot:12377151-Alexandrium_andersonii.AAC.1
MGLSGAWTLSNTLCGSRVPSARSPGLFGLSWSLRCSPGLSGALRGLSGTLRGSLVLSVALQG